MKNKIALITGVDGFTGHHLAMKLRERHYDVVGVDIGPKSRNPAIMDDYLSADLRDKHSVDKIFLRVMPDHVFHLAGIFRGSEIEIYRSNFIAGINLLDSIATYASSARVLVVGSAAEYGYVAEEEMPIKESQACNPIHTYAISKYALTMASRDYFFRKGLKVVVARPFNLIGPGLSEHLILGAILKRVKEAILKSDSLIKVGRTDTQRDFLPVMDAVEAYIQLTEGEFWGEIVNICSGIPRRISSVIEYLFANFGKRFHLEEDPALIRPTDVKISYGSYEKANKLFGFTPKTDFMKTLSEMCQSL